MKKSVKPATSKKSKASIRRNSLRDAPGWVHMLACGSFGIVVLVLLVLYFFYKDTNVWLIVMDNHRADDPFHEAINSSSIFRAPMNTISNLGFVFVGLYIVAYSLWDMRRPTTDKDPYAVRQPALMILFGLACVLLGFGSGHMHASLTRLGHDADIYGMYLCMLTLIGLQWARLIPAVPFTNNRWPSWPIFGMIAIIGSFFLMRYIWTMGATSTMIWLLTIAGLGVCLDRFMTPAFLQFRWPVLAFLSLALAYYTWGLELDGTWLIGLLSIAGLGVCLDRFLRPTIQQIRWPLLAFVSIALAYYIWGIDLSGRWFTAPEHWFQGHAIWHLLGAVTLVSMAIFYRSELPRANQRENTQT